MLALAGLLAGCGPTDANPTFQVNPTVTPNDTAPSNPTVEPNPTTAPNPTVEPNPTVAPNPTPAAFVPSDEFPNQPPEIAWPTDEWVEAEWPAGVDRESVDSATDRAFNEGLDERVRATLIVHRGALVYERYSPNPNDGPDVVMPSFSVAKSITSALVGVLVGDGLIDVSDPAPVPEWHADADDPRAEITIEHLLHMTTGLPWRDSLSAGSNTLGLATSSDMAAYAADFPLVNEPGTRFAYNSGSTVLLDRMIGDIVGETADDMREFMDAELFDRIGMEPVNTAFDEAGTWAGWYSANTTARDFAKFGLLYVRGGAWDGEQLLPREWVEYSRTPSAASDEYGAQWWLDPTRPELMHAIGLNGQVITVDPRHDLVIVQLSTVGGALPLQQTEAILEAFSALG